MPLRYDQLGRRDTQRFSVPILGNERERSDDPRMQLRNTLRLAVGPCARPKRSPYSHVTHGLEAHDRWSQSLKSGTLADCELQFADYYAEMYFSLRCCVRDYLSRWGEHDKRLQDVSCAYGRVASHLGEAYRLLVANKHHPAPIREQTASHVRSAAAEEKRAIASIEAYVLDALRDGSIQRAISP